MLFIIFVVLLSPGALDAGAPGRSQKPADSPDCPELDSVLYRQAQPDALANITLERPPGAAKAPARGLDVHRTPQGTAWFVMREPDTTKPGPWSTSIDVVGNKVRNLRLRLWLSDHMSGGVRANWLNEKLLWVQVWRGRIASTDMILDVDTGRFIYQQDANYNAFTVPCAMKIREPSTSR
jgi:hypothetical protein